ncbi:MAG: methanol--corrinoid methyltransferase [Chloroflexi bacterium]|nr:MAG: methanol--corrinoid methyltransferase [Chloroflexota bacterium]
MPTKTFSSLAISNLDDFIYGVSPKPVTLKNGLVIGGGIVYPELNFTLPEMSISAETMAEVREQYSQMINGACTRAAELYARGLVVEFELLPDQTLVPEWGADVVLILREALDELQAKHDIPTALRVTPNDIREFSRPPVMRSGEYVMNMFRSFELCAQAGADFLSIESTGGKEVHDDAILNGDLPRAVFALGVLGGRDMAYLWQRITEIGGQYGAQPAGDSACGFGNTAMVLAEQHYIPRVWAAVIRVLSVARSLVAFEEGAIGPNKDCAYEGPYIKAITGCPISLEGAEAAVAHLSPVGNIARAVADLWSNESVNNVKLLGGMAPTISLEQLVYATRLMNTAAQKGKESARMLRDWYVESDAAFDPQAYVLRPDVVLKLAAEIIQEPTPYLRTRRAALCTLDMLRNAAAAGQVQTTKLESRWLDRLAKQADTLPIDEEELVASIGPELDESKVLLREYNL